MAASWVLVPCSSPGVTNWCHRGNDEASVARIARLRSKKRLEFCSGVWSGQLRPLLHMASAAEGRLAADLSSSSPALEAQEKEAAEMVQEFYAAINRREIASIAELFADDCVYEDLVFPKPFLGRKLKHVSMKIWILEKPTLAIDDVAILEKPTLEEGIMLAILEFFQKFMDSVGSELEFKVDDITTGDPNAAGVTWHLDWKGKPLPFSKGCSFYRCQVLSGKRQFVYGRDAVEPATKPGDLTLVALKGLAALLRRFPSIADKF